jgi:hypothetical protein
MKSMRILGLALVAVFALVAISAASASAAEPAFYECAKVAKGETGPYEKGCAKEGGKGGYVLREGIGKKHTFKGKGGKATLHTPAVGGEVTCAKFADSGELTSPTTEGKVVSVFSKCTSLGKVCASPGAKKGTIETKDLSGSLGYLNKAKHEVGVDLKAESGSVLAEFECEGLTVVVTGSVIGQITPVNTFTKTSTTTFEVNAEKFQKYKKFESGPENVLESEIDGTGPYESGQEPSATNKGEDLEIKA